ncbi:hypothetical protein M747DRAFT_311751 [Aspergillus niger ATCC 13496]|uniref:Contig An02c0010, genomic contig n=3 Tax=Aspergillus niger TaxID=5061 RepID=A2QBS7_ASPNC|nr:uncharacterized protein An02g01080 [Aspergillus niger]RDH25021.1 hypothetical protein M747DRAFT_311751 [Aspergillus niger ATCC 13496]CAK96324.1 unnamed protein product [Aspergillus niger]
MSPLNQLYDLSRFVVMPVSHNAIGASTIIWPVPTIDFGVQHTLGMELPSDIGSYQESSAKPRVRSQVASPSPGPDVDSDRPALSAFPSIAEGIEPPRHANTFLNNVTYFTGYHIFPEEGQKWIETQVGESIEFDKLFALELQWFQPLRFFADSATHPSPLPSLPPRPVLERHILVYSSSFQSLVFPVVSKSTFCRTLDLAYSPIPSPGSASAKSCVYSFLALVSLFGFDDASHDCMDCRSFPQLITRQVQLQYFLGDLRSAGVTLSIATRLLYALGAHILPTKATPSRAPVYDKSDIRCHLRDLFWLCYSFDKDICIRTGQPPSLNDTHCDLSLPDDYVQLQNINLQHDMPPVNDNTIPLYPWDLRLSMLKSRIYEGLYSAVSLYQSASQLLSSIRALDETLEQWRVSLPSDFRPTLYFSDDTHISANVNTQAVMLRLAYYHCVTSIHQAANRYRNSALDPAGTWLSGITSSINLSITASRSTLSYLKRVLPIIKGKCFWIILFYAITAVLTLFCDTISDPHGPDVHHNVELLQDVPGLIHRVPVRHLALGELTHLQYLNGFTTELAAICVRATSKARRG